MKTSIKAPASSFWIPCLGLFGVLFVLFFYHLGHYPLFDVDEPRYAEAAREMIERNNWITPYFNYELRFDKPVLFYWLVAISYQLWGVTEFSARLISALGGALTACMLFVIGRSWLSNRFGLFSALIFATSLEVIALSRMSVTDMTLCGFMTATTLCLFLVKHHHKSWWLAAGAFAGLSVLTKGPVGIVIPGAVFLIYTVLIQDFKRCFLNRYLPLALAVFLAVCLPWYWLAYQQNGWVFIQEFFIKHNLTRTVGVVSGHQQPIYFFFIVVLAGFLPWSVFLPVAITYWVKKLGLGWPKPETLNNPVSSMALFSGIWALFIFVFFTLAQTKLLTYILPMFPPLAFFIAATFEQALETHEIKLRKWLTGMSALLTLILIGVSVVFITHMSALLPREAQEVTANQWNYVVAGLFIVGTGSMTLALWRQKIQTALWIQIASMTILAWAAVTGVIPRINQATQGEMMTYVKQAQGRPIVMYEIIRPSLTYYARKKIIYVPQNDYATLYSLIPSHGSIVVITKNRFVQQLQHLPPAKVDVKLVNQGPLYSLLTLEAPHG